MLRFKLLASRIKLLSALTNKTFIEKVEEKVMNYFNSLKGKEVKSDYFTSYKAKELEITNPVLAKLGN